MNKQAANLLEQFFDTAFAAPDGIAKLRELILTLAMQGKLVEQDPNDPPASVLLKEIEAERKRGSHEGTKTRRKEKLPPIKPEEVPYELPQGWEWVRLGKVVEILDSLRKPVTKQDREPGPYPYYGASGIVDYVSNYIFDEPLVLVGEDGAKWEKGDNTAFSISGKTWVNNHAHVLRPDRSVLNDGFLIYCLVGMDMQPYITGMTVPKLNQARLVSILVPLPPLPEQHRIVARIDQLMARCDELERLRKEREEKRVAVHAAAVRQLLDAPDRSAQKAGGSAWEFIEQHFGELYTVKENVAELRKAILQLAVMGRLSEQTEKDEPVSALLTNVYAERQRLKIRKTTDLINSPKPLGYAIPEQWKWVYLDDVLVLGPINGFSPREVDYETNIRSLTLSATTSGTFKGEYSKFIDIEISNDSDLWLCDGDILVQRGNTIEYVGVPAVYRGNPGVYVYPDLMMKLRVSSHMDTDYVYYAMSSVPAREYLRAHASGTSGTMPKINQKTLKSLPLPVPPLEEQHRIVVKIKKLMKFCELLDQQIDAATGKQSELLNAVMAQV